MFTAKEKATLLRGERVVIANAVYCLCFKCRCVIKVNKWLFGSLHVCIKQEEKKDKRND